MAFVATSLFVGREIAEKTMPPKPNLTSISPSSDLPFRAKSPVTAANTIKPPALPDAQEGQGVQVRTVDCVEKTGVRVCVLDPVPMDNLKLWCPSYMCGPSFVPATRCVSGPDRATHVCRVESSSMIGYECEQPKQHKWFDFPWNCAPGTCERAVRTCSCLRASVGRHKVTVLHPIPQSACDQV